MKSSRPLLFLLLRHEETESPRGVLYGQRDVPLSSRGRRRTEKLVERLSRLPVEAVYSSDLSRALYGAELLSRRTGAPLFVTPLLREIDFGEWTGLSLSELLEIPEFAQRLATPEKISPPGGESLSQLFARASRMLDLIRRKHPGGLVVTFAHGGFNRALVSSVLGLSPRRFFTLEQHPGALNLLVFFPEGVPLLALFNAPAEIDLAHWVEYYGGGAEPPRSN
ncbi:histidine phosphatase family protein [Thermosulfurimonas sp.]|uniref:histidine phosphatase family protein n=1 Tax=Thermosulfurimonas sp. TaxID=2080236 RepID=UPI0025CEC059|nr:histidine phosphatase family protein [Thermosulfurimonas sp.]